MGEYFVTITLLNRAPMTLMREAKSQGDLQRSLVKEFGEGVSFQCSERTEPRTVAETRTPPRRTSNPRRHNPARRSTLGALRSGNDG